MQLKRPVTYNTKNIENKLFTENLFKMFKGNISYGSGINTPDKNIQGFMVEIADSSGANTSIAITHNLGYVPKFYDVKYISAATQIFDFGTPWTKTKIFLASSTAHIKFRVFIH